MRLVNLYRRVPVVVDRRRRAAELTIQNQLAQAAQNRPSSSTTNAQASTAALPTIPKASHSGIADEPMVKDELGGGSSVETPTDGSDGGIEFDGEDAVEHDDDPGVTPSILANRMRWVPPKTLDLDDVGIMRFATSADFISAPGREAPIVIRSD